MKTPGEEADRGTDGKPEDPDEVRALTHSGPYFIIVYFSFSSKQGSE